MSAVHQEARYLKALCHSRQGDLEDALRALLPLRGRQLDDELRSQVHDLRRGLRGVVTPNAILAFLLTFPIEPAPAEARLRDTISLDPEVEELYFVLAAALASSGNLEDALEVTEQGVENVTDDGQRLQAMTDELRRRLVRPKLRWAVEAFKEESYREAKQKLEGLSARWREISVVEDFDAYVTELVRRRKTARGLLPKGPFERVDALYFVLAGDEIESAKRSIAQGDYGQAERVLEQAMSFAPQFPYLNFLYALSIYHGVGEWLGDPEDLDFDGQLERLNRAARSAEVAGTDHEIGQAGALAEAIEGLRDFIAKAHERRQAHDHEVRVINAAIEEFRSIMESAKGGLGGPEDLADLKRRLRELGKSMPDLRRAAVSAEGKQAVEQLEKAVERNLADLGQATAVHGCFEKFQEIMGGIKDGIESEAQLLELQQQLRDLRDRITEARKRVDDKGARRSLDQLAKTVGGHLKQLQKSAPSAAVGTLVAEFNAIMESVEGGIESQAQIEELDRRLGKLWVRVMDERSRTKDKDAKRGLDQLSTAIGRHRGELSKALSGPRINNLVKMFNTVMESISSGSPMTPQDAAEKRQMMEFIRDRVRDERSSATSGDARKALDDLEAATTQVITALGG